MRAREKTLHERSQVETCRHRWNVQGKGAQEQARCHLLDRLVAPIVGNGRLLDREVCEACVDSFPSTLVDVNPVLASIVYSIAEEQANALQRDVVVRRRAEALRDWAERCIPRVFPDEEDLSLDLLANPSCDWVEIETLLPPPERRCGPEVRQWAVGVTTAPRRLPTLEYCLDGLSGAGWPEPVLFADESLELPKRFEELTVTVRRPRVGAWPNYYLALAELTLRQPEADVYMILQDDALLFHHPQLREYLEEILWPGDRPGLVSLYCARDYTQGQSGWHELPMQWVWGALAFLFPAEVARQFLRDPQVQAHRKTGQSGGLSGIDLVIGKFAFENEIPIHFPTPSLVQHIGQVSTLWNSARASGSRKAERFAGAIAQQFADPDPGNRTPQKPAEGSNSTVLGVRFVRSLEHVLGRRTHRSGWPYAFVSLQPLADSRGLRFDDAIEQNFAFSSRPEAYKEPWVGVFHQPPNMPPFLKPQHSLPVLFRSPVWQESFPHLIGAIALSEYLAAFLSESLGVPTFAVKHPTEPPEVRWSPDRYARNASRRLIQVGWYLKNTQLIFQIPMLPGLKKMRLLACEENVRSYDQRVRRYWTDRGTRSARWVDQAEDLGRVSAAGYDRLLVENVVVAEVFDASASNVVLDCIGRTTPMVINRHPAVVEYLGVDYPLYFADPFEIPDLLQEDRVLKAYAYLSKLDRTWLPGTAFRESVRSVLEVLTQRMTSA